VNEWVAFADMRLNVAWCLGLVEAASEQRA
jgi:hypothetical protein